MAILTWRSYDHAAAGARDYEVAEQGKLQTILSGLKSARKSKSHPSYSLDNHLAWRPISADLSAEIGRSPRESEMWEIYYSLFNYKLIY